MNIVNNHPATKPNYPATAAMAAEARNIKIDSAINTAIQKTTLEEYLNEDESFNETIDNLKQLLAHYNLSTIVSPVVMIDLRMALKALSNINKTMELTP